MRREFRPVRLPIVHVAKAGERNFVFQAARHYVRSGEVIRTISQTVRGRVVVRARVGR
jgi:hypothetical protein